MKIPVNIKRPVGYPDVMPAHTSPMIGPDQPVTDWEAVTRARPGAENAGPVARPAVRLPVEAPTRPEPAISRQESWGKKGEEERGKEETEKRKRGKEEADSLETWRSQALSLQADMENFRRRQQRLAQETIQADRMRLLQSFLTVADDLERALRANPARAEGLQEGVRLTYQSLLQLLSREGVETIQAEGQPFDPTWHEAVDTAPAGEGQSQAGDVLRVVQSGYRLGDRLLRPARVIVAR